MKQVWKCDFCSETNDDKSIIQKHEPSCVFNPITKHCYSCKHEYEAGVPMSDRHRTGCEINLNTDKGEDEGNCKGWELDNE
jgi:hypothetical protein